MIIIMDEQDKQRMGRHGGSVTHDTTGLDNRLLYMSDYIVVLKDDTYEVIKDRYSDEHGSHFPLGEFPEEIKQKIIAKFKYRDDIDDTEE